MNLGADEPAGSARLLPVRMLNEYAYCPRLFFLEWVQGEFADNEHTLDGRGVHRRVDAGAGAVPPPEESLPYVVRSVSLASAALGLSAKIDLIEGEGSAVVPVDYKRGKPPPVEEGAYEPERVQLCVQGMILEEHGYTCHEGVLYFAESRERVPVALDEELRAQARNAIDGLVLPALQIRH